MLDSYDPVRHCRCSPVIKYCRKIVLSIELLQNSGKSSKRLWSAGSTYHLAIAIKCKCTVLSVNKMVNGSLENPQD
jgi:hypothetical protein